MEQHVQYCTTPDGVRIAYAVTGSGPPLLWVPGWISHLDLELTSADQRAWTELLSSRLTLVRHDKRGTGLSSWRLGDYSLESSVRDVELLADHLKLQRFAIGGFTEGGAIALLYAARHPERTTRVVVYGSYASGERLFDPPELRDAVRTLAATRWPVAAKLLAAIFLGESGYVEPGPLAAFFLASAASEDVPALLNRATDFDIRAALSQVRAPTLVMHNRHDMVVPIELGQEIAAGVPGARFLPGPGGHMPPPGAFLEVGRAILSFLFEDEAGDLTPYPEDGAGLGAPAPAGPRQAGRLTRTPRYADDHLVIDTEHHLVALDGHPLDLSPTEFRLLVVMASAPGRMHSYDELLHRVWGAGYVGQTDFLHVYIARLRRKLGREVIETARGFGYRFVGRQ